MINHPFPLSSRDLSLLSQFVILWRKSAFIECESLGEKLDYPSLFSQYQSFSECPGTQKTQSSSIAYGDGFLSLAILPYVALASVTASVVSGCREPSYGSRFQTTVLEHICLIPLYYSIFKRRCSSKNLLGS